MTDTPAPSAIAPLDLDALRRLAREDAEYGHLYSIIAIPTLFALLDRLEAAEAVCSEGPWIDRMDGDECVFCGERFPGPNGLQVASDPLTHAMRCEWRAWRALVQGR